MLDSNFSDHEEQDDIIDVFRIRARSEWGVEFLARHGAIALSVGWKVTRGLPTRHVSVRLHVPRGTKARRQRGVDFIKDRLDGGTSPSGRSLIVATDVEEADQPHVSAENPLAMHRVIPGGVSIGSVDNAGTLGGWVWDLVDQSPVLLSAAHVFGFETGVEVMQPARVDRLARPKRVIGHVKRVTPLVDGTNQVDAAIASVRNMSPALRVLRVGPAVMATARPRLGLPVEKFGKTTGYTVGRIKDAVWQGWVSQGDTPVFYADCFRTIEQRRRPWAQRGDSGSLVFAREPLRDGSRVKPAVGLHFAEDDTDSRLGISCRIENVFAQLELATFPEGLWQILVRDLEPGRQRAIAALIPALRDRLTTGPGGREVLEVFETHRSAVVQTILRFSAVRTSLSRVFALLFADAPTVLEAPVSRAVIRTAADFLEKLRDRTEGRLRRTCTSLIRRITSGHGASLVQILELKR